VPALKIVFSDLATQNSTEMKKISDVFLLRAQEERFMGGRNFKNGFNGDKEDYAGHTK